MEMPIKVKVEVKQWLPPASGTNTDRTYYSCGNIILHVVCNAMFLLDTIVRSIRLPHAGLLASARVKTIPGGTRGMEQGKCFCIG